MKRMLLTSLCLVLAMPFMVIGQEAAPFIVPANETSLSTGFEFGTSIEHGGTAASDKGNRYFGSPGMNIALYSFWNGGNFGLFYHGAWMFPTLGDEDYDFQFTGFIGPAFRFRFTDKLTLQTGIGIGSKGMFSWYEENGTDYHRYSSFLTAGVNAGLQYDITDKFFIKGGVTAEWSFLGWTKVRERSSGMGSGDWKRLNGYWAVDTNPYLSFGMNIYSPKRAIPRSEGPRFGKPSRVGAAQQ